jgi:hypothetical protein
MPHVSSAVLDAERGLVWQGSEKNQRLLGTTMVKADTTGLDAVLQAISMYAVRKVGN